MGFESTHLHIICILSCPSSLSDAFCRPISGSQSVGSSTPLTQTHLWRLGLLKSVPLGCLCDSPLPVHIFGDPHPASQGYLKGSLLAQSASSLTVLVSGESHTFPHFTTPLSSPSLESPFCNLTSIFCAAVCPEGTQMWGQRWGIIEKPITSPPPHLPY